MNKEWQTFCATLDVSHHDAAQQIWQSLSDAGKPQPQLKANTKQIYSQ